MKGILGLVLIIGLAWSIPAAAQSSRIYAGASTALDTGGRNQVDIGVLPAAGGLVGLRLSGAWSVEFEADRGWGSSDPRVFEGLLLSQVGPGATEDERLRNGIFGRSAHQEWAGTGYSANVVWRSRDPGRVNAALFASLSWRRFEVGRTVTITEVGPGVTYPPGHINLQDVNERRQVIGGGYGGGVMVPIALTPRLTLAPVARFTLGAIDGDWGYKVFYTGVRAMWGF